MEPDPNHKIALRYLRLGEIFLKKGNLEKAAEFGLKAQKLGLHCPYLKEIEECIGRPKCNLNNQEYQSNQSSSSGAGKEFTSEQFEAVKSVRKCQDYYQILGVTKEASNSDLKKAYRKLALQFHPDKNHAPGAGEAFKIISNAFGILSDSEKRRKYNLYGPAMEHRPPTMRNPSNRSHRSYRYSIFFVKSIFYDFFYYLSFLCSICNM